MAEPKRIIVIGGSSGALEALRIVVSRLPRDLSAAICVAVHISPGTRGMTDRILTRAGALPAVYPRDRQRIESGHIYIAPPDRHLLVGAGILRLTRGPRENGFRPAIDPLFRTAAVAYGARVIGVVLSGGQDDGAAGLAAIKAAGGLAIVQEPAEATAPSMPMAAIRHVRVDHVLSASDMPAVLAGLVNERIGVDAPEAHVSHTSHRDTAEFGGHDIHHPEQLGTPTPFTCPDCGGTLWQSEEAGLLQFRCHTGHRFSGETLTASQSESLEHALWTALRALEESAELRRRMAGRASASGLSVISAGYEQQAVESEHRATTIREILMPEGGHPAVTDTSPSEVSRHE